MLVDNENRLFAQNIRSDLVEASTKTHTYQRSNVDCATKTIFFLVFFNFLNNSTQISYLY